MSNKTLEWHEYSLRISLLDLVAVLYLSSNAKSLVQTWQEASLAGDRSLARFLLVSTMLKGMGLVMSLW